MDKFQLKTQLDNKMYALYNFFSECRFRLDANNRELIRNNFKFKNVHKGGSCYILGTGPSLSELSLADISHIKMNKTIAVNSFYKSDISKNLTPDYYSLLDNVYWEEEGWIDTFFEIGNVYGPASETRFITDYRARTLLNSLPISLDPIYLYTKKYPYAEVSCDLSKNMSAVMNVVSYSILVAMYLGFDKIYLLGCDYNAFCNMGNGHCYDDKSEEADYNLSFYLKFYWFCTEFHYLIAKLAKEQSVTIINLTSTSLLDAYPRMPFSKHINNGE
ncbi:DUF115 domain-containing protein [Gammaproteobacteria bacterium]|nr:DUF115 domain-containing protein [Gammaproteobacteria bacterium]